MLDLHLDIQQNSSTPAGKWVTQEQAATETPF